MVLTYEIDPSELVEKTSQELKNIAEIKPPAWASIVKTGAHKERPPVNKDWWYIRAAALLRTVARMGPIGVSKLTTKYGGKKNRGVQPEKFYKGSGSIIRKILQQLDNAGLTTRVEKGDHKGRIITPKGLKLLNDIAAKIKGAKPKKPQEKKEPPIVEEKKPDKEDNIKKDDKTAEKLDKTKEKKQEKKQEKVKKLVKEEAKKGKSKKHEKGELKVPTAEELLKKKQASEKNG